MDRYSAGYDAAKVKAIDIPIVLCETSTLRRDNNAEFSAEVNQSDYLIMSLRCPQSGSGTVSR